MTHTPSGTRQAQKQRTRQALLDAALRLMEDQSLSSLSLREVTRAVGIAPAAFYRHFRDIPDLGAALVEESLGSLRAVIRAERDGETDPQQIINRSIDVLAARVRENRAHFRFIAREKFGGVAPVRLAIRDELKRFTADLAADLALLPGTTDWDIEDRTMLAGLFVDHLVLTAANLLDVPASEPDEERRIIDLARSQLELIAVGRQHWCAASAAARPDAAGPDQRG